MPKHTQIGLGLAAIGRPEYINIKKDDIPQTQEVFQANAMQVLDDAYRFGVRYFDVAPSYGKGEQFLIDWHNSRAYPDVTLSTKWGYTYMANWELGYEGKHEIKEHSLPKLLEQWQVSQVLLPELKIYQVHSATLESGIFTNTDVLKELHKIKQDTGVQIGISTSGSNQAEIIEKALTINIEGEDLFSSFQVTYNVFEQSTFKILKTLLGDQKTVIIKEALANGRVFPNDTFSNYQAAYTYFHVLSKKYNVGIDAIALRFVIDSLEPHVVLSGALTSPQLQDNLKALSFQLATEEIQQLQIFASPSQLYWEERSALAWR
ncbi:aldo/keto reductase [Formosa algae]|uniref:Aryl-alcohol dehydrogenase-like predicted oxidoreductase n=1 Tax=Formosa algae TaxID=225843 RepID=A0A9X0YIT2_9FLAO|nr:aldo/keto reductase [Formosa algae]MBP1839246.1 aryl-alcohol dehydrogenase-like predicted oxidoreductase [Formosa algae]MDQ0334023.1 aryl-alcohol dehydrogenase-like predicted oxidoreductase [Formosa algae]OEI79351.1 oxidoreductase [Formosa algae]